MGRELTKKQWLLSASLSPERVAPTPALPALSLKLVSAGAFHAATTRAGAQSE